MNMALLNQKQLKIKIELPVINRQLDKYIHKLLFSKLTYRLLKNTHIFINSDYSTYVFMLPNDLV